MRLRPRLWLPLLLPLAVPTDLPPSLFDPGAAIRAVPVALDTDRPWRVRAGGLRYLRGWALRSDNARFGGLSAMVAWRGGLLAVSDEGQMVRFAPGPGAAWRARHGPLPDIGRVARKVDRDTEAMTIDPATGRLWVATENGNRVLRFAPGAARLEASAAPRAMRGWPFNGGTEALARLPDGRFLLIAERQRGDVRGTRRALLFAGDPTAAAATPIAFSYRPPPGCDPSDAAALPDGRVLVLNRCLSRLSGFAAVIERIDPARVRPDGIVAGQRLARLAPPLVTDNYEALTVTATADGIHLWIASDDNFMILQRTLLLEFRIEG